MVERLYPCWHNVRSFRLDERMTYEDALPSHRRCFSFTLHKINQWEPIFSRKPIDSFLTRNRHFFNVLRNFDPRLSVYLDQLKHTPKRWLRLARHLGHFFFGGGVCEKYRAKFFKDYHSTYVHRYHRKKGDRQKYARKRTKWVPTPNESIECPWLASEYSVSSLISLLATIVERASQGASNRAATFSK